MKEGDWVRICIFGDDIFFGTIVGMDGECFLVRVVAEDGESDIGKFYKDEVILIQEAIR